MRRLAIAKAFTLIEPGPVVLVATHDLGRDNVMVVSWTMVLDFTPRFAIATGAWNFSYAALTRTKECVIGIPGVDMLDRVIGIGMCSGREVDKFARFGLARAKAGQVAAPVLAECLANIECRVVDVVERFGIVVLDGVAAWVDAGRAERRTLHAVGDGVFVADGERFDRRAAMRGKLPAGI